LYKTSNITNINICLGNLFLINVISLYATIYLSVLVDALSMLLIAFRELYDLIKLIIDAFIVAHVSVNVNLKGDNSI
jgi:hypothetical protein